MHAILSEAAIARMDQYRIYTEYHGRHRLKPGDRVEFAEHGSIEPYCAILNGAVIPRLGSFSYSWSPLPDDMPVGRYCSIAYGLMVMMGNHPLDAVSTSSFVYDRVFPIFTKCLDDHGVREFQRFSLPPTRPNRNDLPLIGHDVWIGANATLARGIVVGTGSVVGAAAVVTKSVPPYMVVAGNPARVIKSRFPEALVERLLASAWWRYKLSDFAGLPLDRPEMFLDELQRKLEDKRIAPFTPDPIRLADLLKAG